MGRQHIAMELITNEISYLNYVKRLEKLQTELYEGGILPAAQIEIIFSNVRCFQIHTPHKFLRLLHTVQISEIYRINHSFLQRFRKHTG